MKQIAATGLAFALAIGTAHGQESKGYYDGPQTFYPYDPVYTDNADGGGQGYGWHRVAPIPKSAPLPPNDTLCKWADISGADLTTGWYQWKAREMPPERAKYLGAKVCFFEDRGAPKNVNDLQHDAR